MNTAIICGGTINKDFTAFFLKKQNIDCIIAADKGLEFCYEEKIMPDYILGDYDSIRQETLAWYKEHSKTPLMVFPPEKDDTDAGLALEKALKIGSSKIYMLGALGGRMDHCIANIHMLKTALDRGTEAYLADEQNLISLIEKETVIHKEEQFGKYISFLPFTDEVEGITLEGFKYPLADYTMKKGQSIGVSNEMVSEFCRVTFKRGILLMIQSKDKN